MDPPTATASTTKDPAIPTLHIRVGRVGEEVEGKARPTEEHPGMSTTLTGRPLKEAEMVVRVRKRKQARNISTVEPLSYLKWRGSVIPRILGPCLIFTGWGALWVYLINLYGLKQAAVAPLLITILALVIGLLLVFRTNTAYDRYWQGRTLFGNVMSQLRNVSRALWISVVVPAQGIPEERRTVLQARKVGAMHLLAAFPIALKHYLRAEEGVEFRDLYPLLCHLPQYVEDHPGLLAANPIPLEITFHLNEFFQDLKAGGIIDMPQLLAFTVLLHSLVDSLTHLERVRNSPIPKAYSLHLRHALFLYLASLPFQLAATLGWSTVFVMLIASFTLLGIEAIGEAIENPFGYDEDDLPLNQYCQAMSDEVCLLMQEDRRLPWAPIATALQVGGYATTLNQA